MISDVIRLTLFMICILIEFFIHIGILSFDYSFISKRNNRNQYTNTLHKPCELISVIIKGKSCFGNLKLQTAYIVRVMLNIPLQSSCFGTVRIDKILCIKKVLFFCDKLLLFDYRSLFFSILFSAFAILSDSVSILIVLLLISSGT